MRYDPAQANILSAEVAHGQWSSIRDGHCPVPMHDGRVLDWTGDGTWRLWNYDPRGRSMVSGTIVLRNETQERQTHVRVQASDNTLLMGNSAEWIVERPASTGGPLTPLADYGKVQFTHAHAERIGGATMKPVDGDTISMTEHGKTVSTGRGHRRDRDLHVRVNDNGASHGEGAVVFEAGGPAGN